MKLLNGFTDAQFCQSHLSVAINRSWIDDIPTLTSEMTDLSLYLKSFPACNDVFESIITKSQFDHCLNSLDG
jgi:hypothetical protein